MYFFFQTLFHNASASTIFFLILHSHIRMVIEIPVGRLPFDAPLILRNIFWKLNLIRNAYFIECDEFTNESYVLISVDFKVILLTRRKTELR